MLGAQSTLSPLVDQLREREMRRNEKLCHKEKKHNFFSLSGEKKFLFCCIFKYLKMSIMKEITILLHIKLYKVYIKRTLEIHENFEAIYSDFSFKASKNCF